MKQINESRNLDAFDRAIVQWMAEHCLAVLRVSLGIGLIVGRSLRATLLLLFLQMPDTALPLVVLPPR